MSDASPDVTPWTGDDWLARIRAGSERLIGPVLLLLVALVAGFLWYRAGLRGGGEELAPAPTAVTAPRTSPTSAAPLVVHVAGAVNRPGLYHLAAGSRVADAVDAAGGPVARADLDRLNLAGRVSDGQRVAVPRQGEPAPATVDGATADPATADGTSEPVDLNSAGAAQLEALPGIGPARARAILAERAKRGGFHSVRDLLRVPGIGERRFAELREHVRV